MTVPVQTAEPAERAQFEAWAKEAYPNGAVPDNAWIIWQAARAALREGAVQPAEGQRRCICCGGSGWED